MHHHDAPSPHGRKASGGRHRRGGGARRRVAGGPSFRTAVTLTGVAAAVLTVALGAYVAATERTPGTEPRARAAAGSVPAPLAVGAAPRPAGYGAARPAAATAPARVSPAGTVSGPVRGRSPSPDAGSTADRTGTLPPAPVRRETGRATVAPVGRGPADYVEQVVALANEEREKAGCRPLRAERRLRSSAQAHADDMAARDYYDHESPEGRDAGDRISRTGYAWSAWGENIHRGPKSAVRVMEDWMDSDAHRHNILNCSFTEIGVGVALTANGPWWVQNFGARR
ncbi:CAP domain-containing protein [Streptomyces sp. NPDC006460]|uniref:CAP domain-containing protein n=1 Tax=Streptomyces sp. NPDC006460 TaxID=3154304 RepID=UPI00339EC5E6